MRAAASSWVVHASDVPALFTSGSAKHCVVAAQPMFTNLPPTHIAKPPSMQAWSPSVRNGQHLRQLRREKDIPEQEESAVSDANCALSFCASSAFWSWKFEDDAAVVVEAAAVVVVAEASVLVAAASVVVAAASVVVAAAAVLDAELSPDPVETFPRPGSCVMSESCEPSAMGPSGCAAHEPSGLSGSVCPKGMVPGAPTARPPTKDCWFAPWNWHWNRPLSSEFFGACWQYGTASELGCEREQCQRICHTDEDMVIRS